MDYISTPFLLDMLGKRDKNQEVDKIKERLRQGEEILLATTQARAVKPSTYFVTTERVLIRAVGIMGDKITSIQWTDVGDFQMAKGAMRASIEFVKSSNGQTITIADIRKDDAEQMYELIEKYINQALQNATAQSNGSAPPPSAQSPLDALKMKLVNGEITEEEFEKKKKLLE